MKLIKSEIKMKKEEKDQKFNELEIENREQN